MSNETTLDTSEYRGKYLTFNLMKEFYGISVDKILQIIAIPEIIQIPQTPVFVKGVINLRGKIIPVMDLRLRFKLPEQEYNDRTSIVIITIKSNNEEFFIGTIVDSVNEVIDINSEEIEHRPVFGGDINTEFILAMAKVKNKVVTLLDISKILTEAELSNLRGEN